MELAILVIHVIVAVVAILVIDFFNTLCIPVPSCSTKFRSLNILINSGFLGFENPSRNSSCETPSWIPPLDEITNLLSNISNFGEY